MVPARVGSGPRDSDDGRRSSSQSELSVSPGAGRVESELFKYNIQKLHRPDMGDILPTGRFKKKLSFLPLLFMIEIMHVLCR